MATELPEVEEDEGKEKEDVGVLQREGRVERGGWEGQVWEEGGV